uniref:Acetyltransf_18 domain-containing protein n=1 Tax=Soboliphyme baturini TaxID=241478 RepID=A0A183J792_9BILA
LALHYYFSPGLHNLIVFYKSSPIGWQVAEDEDGTTVGYYIYNQLPVEGIRFGYQLLVSRKHTGKGITNMFNMPKKDGVPVIANVTPDTIQRYLIDSWYEKLLCYVGAVFPGRGFPVHPPKNKLNIEEVTDAHLDAIYSYDLGLLGFDRKQFLRLWLNKDEFGKSVCAVKDGIILGYGTLKIAEKYTMIAPVYADSDEVAFAILYELLHDYDMSLTLSLIFPATNAFMCHFVKNLGLQLFTSEMRITRGNCEAVVKNLQMKKVYALHEFWPI